MAIIDTIKNVLQKAEVRPEPKQTVSKSSTIDSKLYECFNCGSHTKSLHDCDTCHGFFCFPCFSNHECRVAYHVEIKEEVLGDMVRKEIKEKITVGVDLSKKRFVNGKTQIYCDKCNDWFYEHSYATHIRRCGGKKDTIKSIDGQGRHYR